MALNVHNHVSDGFDGIVELQKAVEVACVSNIVETDRPISSRAWDLDICVRVF